MMAPQVKAATRHGWARPVAAWYTVIVLMACYTPTVLNRRMLTLLGEHADPPLTHTQLGLALQASALLYAILALPLGLLADRVSRRNLIALLVLVWSLATPT